MKKLTLFAALAVLAFHSLAALAATPVVVPNFIIATYPDPNGKVPTLNGVPGAGVANLDVGLPTGILTHSHFYVYVMGFSNTAFTGTCTVSYKLTQIQAGKTVTLDTSSRNVSSSPGDWAWSWVGKAIPNSPGLATLAATTKCGASTGSTKISVYLQ
jgi:hypothetical protein